MEPGEIDESLPQAAGSKRKGRYKARRQHKRAQTEISLPFDPPKRFRLETHLTQNGQRQQRLPASGHHALLNLSYNGPDTPRWAAFRLSKVVKDDSLGQLEKSVER